MGSFGKVIPGLSLLSQELTNRLKSNNIGVSEEGKSYSTDEKVLETLRMDRAELFRSHLREQKELQGLERRVRENEWNEKLSKSIDRDKELYAKAKADAIRDINSQNNLK